MKVFTTYFYDRAGKCWAGPRLQFRTWESAEQAASAIRLRIEGELVEEVSWGWEGWNLILAVWLRKLARWLENLSGGGYEI